MSLKCQMCLLGESWQNKKKQEYIQMACAKHMKFVVYHTKTICCHIKQTIHPLIIKPKIEITSWIATLFQSCDCQILK